MELLKVLGKSKSIEILQELNSRKLIFREIVEITGNPTTATRRVKELQALGLISREVMQDKFRTVKYSITEKGKESLETVKKLKP